MKWFHKVDPVWLAERKKYLTASDIRKLIPVTATGRSRANMDEAFAKVWADKQCLISEDDIESSGAMARGHLLEQYAIRDFNAIGATNTIYHWDDALIYSKDGVSCSPDALDIKQIDKCPVALSGTGATVVAEIKAYAGPAHYVAGIAKKMTLEERWQIATAMYVMPSIKTGVLIFYNPSANHPLFYHIYSRINLEPELEMIKKVNETYTACAVNLQAIADRHCPPTVTNCCTDEAEIIADLLEEQAVIAGLNP